MNAIQIANDFLAEYHKAQIDEPLDGLIWNAHLAEGLASALEALNRVASALTFTEQQSELARDLYYCSTDPIEDEKYKAYRRAYSEVASKLREALEQ